MQKPETQIRILKVQLHYWQQQAQSEARWLRMSRARSFEIAARMRKLQKLVKPKRKSK